MSDLAKNLLTQYYGLNSESTGKRFLSIHESIQNVKNEEEKQVIEQTSFTTKENESEDESQKNNDVGRKFSSASEPCRRSSQMFNMENVQDSDEKLNIPEFDPGQNVFENMQPSTVYEDSSSIIPDSVSGTEGNGSKDINDNDLSLTLVEDSCPDNASDVSGATLRRSRKSSRTCTSLPPVSKKEPVCNAMFADFSDTELKQFPNGILYKFSRLRMLYMADNSLTELPDEIFTSLRHLRWLDVRNNELSSLPSSIESHPCIETLLLQGNKIVELPLELCTLPKLKTLQVTKNPLTTPPLDIVALGCRTILEFLRKEWNNVHPDRQVEFKENKIEPKLSTILCYQSPRNSKKKYTSAKKPVHNRNVSATEKRKSYKPSNRYYDEELAFLMNVNHPFKKESTFLCDSCFKNEIIPKINKKHKNIHEKRKHTGSAIVANCKSKMDTCVHNETNDMNSKILRLMGPSPRSLYVRQNIKILKTYTRSMKKECKLMLPTNKCERFIPVEIENSIPLVENERKYDSTESEQIFDIITNDRKRFKLHPMRLNNSDWMLSCLENCIGAIK